MLTGGMGECKEPEGGPEQEGVRINMNWGRDRPKGRTSGEGESLGMQ